MKVRHFQNLDSIQKESLLCKSRACGGWLFDHSTIGHISLFYLNRVCKQEANKGVLSVVCQNDRGKNLLFSGKMDCDDKEDYQILDDQSSYLLSIPIRNS